MQILAPSLILAFHGSDQVALQEAVDKALLEWHGGAVQNKQVIHLADTVTSSRAKEGDGELLIHACYAQSLFAERRSIIVNNMELFPKTRLKELLEWIDAPSPETALLMIFSDWNAKSELAKELAKRKMVQKFEAPNLFRIPQWLQENGGQYGFSIPLSVGNQIVEILGPDIDRIRLELRKLQLYFAPQISKKRPFALTIPIVEELLIEQNEGMAYKMHDAFFKRDAAAVNIFRQMLERGTERLVILSGFYNAVAHLLAASLVKKNGGSPEKQAEAMGVTLDSFSRRSSWIGGRSIEELERILLRLEEIEAEIKSGLLRDQNDFSLALLPMLMHRASSRRKNR